MQLRRTITFFQPKIGNNLTRPEEPPSGPLLVPSLECYPAWGIPERIQRAGQSEGEKRLQFVCHCVYMKEEN